MNFFLKNKIMKKEIIMYTDGSALGNPGKGGLGVVLLYKKHRKEISEGYRLTTNNRMELKAVINALDYLNEKRDIIIFTDSKYVMQGIQEWIKKWKTNDWKTAQKKDVKNKDLWVELDNLTDKHSIKWEWVKGHSGDYGNEIADKLAVAQIKR